MSNASSRDGPAQLRSLLSYVSSKGECFEDQVLVSLREFHVFCIYFYGETGGGRFINVGSGTEKGGWRKFWIKSGKFSYPSYYTKFNDICTSS